MNKWLAYLLLTGGAVLLMRANGSSLTALLGGLGGGASGTNTDAPAGGAKPASVPSSIGQIGSNYTKVGSDLGTALDAVAGILKTGADYIDAVVQTADGKASVSTIPKYKTIPAYARGVYAGQISVPLDSALSRFSTTGPVISVNDLKKIGGSFLP